MIRKPSMVFCVLLAFGLSCRAGAGLPSEAGKSPPPASAWKHLCDKAPAFTTKVRSVLLADKDITKKTFRLHEKYRYGTLKDSSKGYAQPMANCIFFEISNKKKPMTLNAEGRLVEKIGVHAKAFNHKNKPLLAGAVKIERAAKVLCESLAEGDAATLKSLKSVAFTGKGGDELSYALRKLSAALADGRKKEAAIWAGEVRGAAVRLTDILRWVDLQSEWIMDLCAVFGSFEPYFDGTDAVLAKTGGWRIFMFGRCPGAQSIQTVCYRDVLTIEHLLIDFYTVGKKDIAAMGKVGWGEAILAVTPARRGACRKILNALPARARPKFRKILQSDYELSAFHSNIWRYEDEGELDNLIRSLKRYVSNYPSPTAKSMMEVIHIRQGAWCATSAAADRYHPKLLEWAGKVKGKPRDALLTAHGFAHELYSRGGYQGSVKTLNDALKDGRMDCIRISQMIGCIYADAGYVGLHPVRVGRGSIRQKKVATSGHTLLSAIFEDGEVGVEGLGAPGFGKPYAERYKGNPRVLSCSRGYRALYGWVAGEIYFPQGPIGPVQLRIPYYSIERKGFSKQTGRPIRPPAPSTHPRRQAGG